VPALPLYLLLSFQALIHLVFSSIQNSIYKTISFLRLSGSWFATTLILSFLIFHQTPQTQAQPANPESLDQILASVNGTLITRNDLQFWLFEFRAQSPELRSLTDNQILSKVLEDAIREELLYQTLWAEDLEPQDKDRKEFLEVSYNTLVEQYGTEERLLDELKYWKLQLSDLRIWLNERVKRDWVIQSAIQEQVHLSETEIVEASEDIDDQYKLREIYIYVKSEREGSEPDAADWRKTEYLLNDIRIDLNSGLTFAQAAKIYSQSPTSLEGGDLGWITESNLSDQLRPEILQLRVGQTTRPIRFEDGIGLYKLDNKKTSSSLMLGDLKKDIRQRALLDALKGAEVEIHPDYPTPSLKVVK